MEPASPNMEGMVNLHHSMYTMQVGICLLVFYMMWRTLITNYQATSLPLNAKMHPLGFNGENLYNSPMFGYNIITHNSLIEIVWTLFPMVCLLIMVVPSFILLFYMEKTSPAITVSVIAHQWFWQYEFGPSMGVLPLLLESFMLPSTKVGSYEQYLEVDNSMMLPVETHMRALVTSSDVMHSWALPALGIKLDACPGSLNEIHFLIKHSGLFYGQCSEICGMNHAFMPMVLLSGNFDDFIQWVECKTIAPKLQLKSWLVGMKTYG